jgi:hypothetical protein
MPTSSTPTPMGHVPATASYRRGAAIATAMPAGSAVTSGRRAWSRHEGAAVTSAPIVPALVQTIGNLLFDVQDHLRAGSRDT